MGKNKEMPVHEEVAALTAKWNPPPQDRALELLVGVPTDPSDVAATAHVPMEELNRHINPAGDGVDAQRLAEYTDDGADDGDGDDGDDGLDDMGKDDLKAEAESRGLSQAGNKGELKARIREHDAEPADEE